MAVPDIFGNEIDFTNQIILFPFTSDPFVFPVFASLSGLALLFVQLGSEKVLFYDATRLVE